MEEYIRIAFNYLDEWMMMQLIVSMPKVGIYNSGMVAIKKEIFKDGPKSERYTTCGQISKIGPHNSEGKKGVRKPYCSAQSFEGYGKKWIDKIQYVTQQLQEVIENQVEKKRL